MKNVVWFLLGVAGGFVVAHFMDKDPRGHEVLADIDARISEFTDRIGDAYREQEARISGVIADAQDAAGELLVPFRTWRNTNTADAAAELSDLFDVNIPLRWSVAHLRQAMLDGEPHLERLAHVTTLAGYVHEHLTGRRVLGVGDASGMFPIVDGDYDERLVQRFDALRQAQGAAPRQARGPGARQRAARR